MKDKPVPIDPADRDLELSLHIARAAYFNAPADSIKRTEAWEAYNALLKATMDRAAKP